MRFAKIWLFSLSFCWLVSACTITPNPVGGQTAVTDVEGGINGFAGFATVDGKRRGLLTDAGRDRYNTLISLYSVQFKKEFGVALQQGDGLVEFKGYHAIDKPHLIYFGWLCQWSRDKRTAD